MLREPRFLIDPSGPSSEPFRALRLAIDLRPDARTGNAIVFTSPQPGDGKSTVSANYAVVAALTESRVLLIDADLRNPSLHRFFGLPRSPGLVELLRDRLDLSDVTHRISDYGRLDVLTSGAILQRAGDIAASRPMGELVKRARELYDLVVIDSPPVLSAADAAGIASHPGTDMVIVAKRSGKRRPLVKALRSLELIEANVLGIVVNREGRLASYAY